jgi:hypothetical protein
MITLAECKKSFEKDYDKMTNENLLLVINQITPLHEVLKKDMLEILDVEEYLVTKYTEAMGILNKRL